MIECEEEETLHGSADWTKMYTVGTLYSEMIRAISQEEESKCMLNEMANTSLHLLLQSDCCGAAEAELYDLAVMRRGQANRERKWRATAAHENSVAIQFKHAF